MVSKQRHPKKPVAEVLKRAQEEGFLVVELHEGHRRGRLVCPDCGARYSIWCTPRVTEYHARQLNKFCDQHREHS